VLPINGGLPGLKSESRGRRQPALGLLGAGVYQSSTYPFTFAIPPGEVVRGAQDWGNS